VAADAAARTALDAFETAGTLSIPVSTLHTSRDPIVPVSQEDGYAGKVDAQGAGSFLNQQAPDRYGHCTFTGPEVLQAFASVTARAAAVRRMD
jgi:hypothetical protein